MEKKNSTTEQNIKKSNFDTRKTIGSPKSNMEKDKRLPWWVELLFVQIGLPDKWLIKMLKAKKNTLDFYKEEKKFLIGLFLFIGALIYFQPVINYSKEKIRCQKTAESYFLENSNINKSNIKLLSMLSVNFCNGGNELNNFKTDNS
tara:strand:- start:13062 stop:13499 length:438 start_codon:yes stop_codon:yes gene_type:complete